MSEIFLTAETRQFLEAIKLIPKKELHEYTPTEWRAGLKAILLTCGNKFEDVHRVLDFHAPSHHGGPDILCRLYEPKFAKRKGVFIYAHGGGWMRGSVDDYDHNLRRMCNIMGIQIISIDYRLSPEHKFPAHLHDCLDAYEYILKNAKTHDIDTRKIYFGGDSAGGNITLGVLLLLIDHNKPLPDKYIGIYPALDLRADMVSAYESYDKYSEGFLLSTTAVNFYIDQYLSKPEDRLNAYASPLLHPKFDQLPPVILVTAEADPLHDEQMIFFKKLRESNIHVQHNIFSGTIHPFVLLGGVFPESCIAMNWIADQLD